MKTLLTLTADNGSVPPPYFRQYTLSFLDNGKAAFSVTGSRDQGNIMLEETYPYERNSLDALTRQLTHIHTPAASGNTTGGAQKQITGYSTATPVTYTIGHDDEGAQQLYNRFLTLCHPGLPARIDTLFYK